MQASPVAAKWFMIAHENYTNRIETEPKQRERGEREGETTLGNLNEAMRGN